MRVDGKPARAGLKLRADQQVEVSPPAPPETHAQPEDIPIEILHLDDQIVVVNKPTGLVVHPGAGRPDGTLVNALLHAVGTLSNIGAPQRPGIVHRIDAGTTGVLVCARTDAAHHHLAAQFAAHTAQRVYRALCWDHGVEDAGTIESIHGRHPGDRRKFSGQGTNGRPAVTHFEVERRAPPCAWLTLKLETGRTHQIRVHMAESGNPLVGDPMYGRRRRIQRPQRLRQLGIELGLTRQALHAATLGFEHPNGEWMEFEAPLPPDLVAIRDALDAPR